MSDQIIALIILILTILLGSVALLTAAYYGVRLLCVLFPTKQITTKQPISYYIAPAPTRAQLEEQHYRAYVGALLNNSPWTAYHVQNNKDRWIDEELSEEPLS